MTRSQLDHILRAAGAITDESELVVLGSQAILGSRPDVPAELRASTEADVFPMHAPEKTDLIDGTMGELSLFQDTHGYYAHGITPESTVLANGWRERLVPLQSPATQGVVGFCLCPADLAISKLAAGREKDFTFVTSLLKHRIALPEDIERLAVGLPKEVGNLVLTNLRICRAHASS